MDGPQNSQALWRGIVEARTAFVSALRCGDADAASATYTDDATLLAPSAELVRGREAIRSFWSAGVETGMSEVELVSLELEHGDQLAYEIGRYAIHVLIPAGERVVDRGKYLLVHACQEDGSWRRAAEMFSPDAVAGKPVGVPA